MEEKFSRLSKGDKVIMVFAYVVLGLFMAAIILPVVYIILASFIDPITLQNSGLTFDFSKWTLTAYERVMGNAQIWVGFKNALLYSGLFTIISVAVTLLAAYPMSCIVNDGDQDPCILINGFGEGYSDPDRGRHLAVTDEKQVISVANTEGFKKGIAWLHQLYAEDDDFDIFEMGTNDQGEPMLKHAPLGDASPVEVREAESVNGPLAIYQKYVDAYYA